MVDQKGSEKTSVETPREIIQKIADIRGQVKSGEVNPLEGAGIVLTESAKLQGLGVDRSGDILAYLRFLAADPIIYTTLIKKISDGRASETPDHPAIQADIALATFLGLDQHSRMGAYLTHLQSLYSQQRGQNSIVSKKTTVYPVKIIGNPDKRRVGRRGFILGGLALGGLAVLGGRKAILSALTQAETSSQPAPTTSSGLRSEVAQDVSNLALPSSISDIPRTADIYPQKEILPPPIIHLGIRNDLPHLMPWLVKMGATNVRIDGGKSITLAGDLLDPQVKEKLREAQKLKLNVLYVFNPQSEITLEEMDRRLKAIYSSRTNVTIELGNEPDDVNVPYWQNRNLTSYARFVKMALERKAVLEQARVIPPNPSMVIGALSYQEHIRKLVQELKNVGINNLNHLTYAIHAYHGADEIRRRSKLVSEATGGAEIMFTEIGVESVNKDDTSNINNINNLIKLYEEARSLTSQPVFIHELPYNGNDAITHEKFGFIKPAGKGIPLEGFEILTKGLQQAEQNITAQNELSPRSKDNKENQTLTIN